MKIDESVKMIVMSAMRWTEEEEEKGISLFLLIVIWNKKIEIPACLPTGFFDLKRFVLFFYIMIGNGDYLKDIF